MENGHVWENWTRFGERTRYECYIFTDNNVLLDTHAERFQYVCDEFKHRHISFTHPKIVSHSYEDLQFSPSAFPLIKKT